MLLPFFLIRCGKYTEKLFYFYLERGEESLFACPFEIDISRLPYSILFMQKKLFFSNYVNRIIVCFEGLFNFSFTLLF